MSVGYAWEKLFLAVSGMASSDGSVQDRLADAFVSQLHRIQDGDMPEEMEAVFRAIRTAMTRNGSFVNSARAMSNEEASNHIEKLVGILSDASRLDGLLFTNMGREAG